MTEASRTWNCNATHLQNQYVVSGFSRTVSASSSWFADADLGRLAREGRAEALRYRNYRFYRDHGPAKAGHYVQVTTLEVAATNH